ncbi:MAG: HEPN domain-containing protein [Planctomycetes bacterium]|nr:HEPN domain-containing protein [Planctomycetota bacterium]
MSLATSPLPPDAFLEDLCFFAQQAAELAIKAVYLQKGWRFDFVHNIGKLLDGLEQQGMVIAPEVQEADQLSLYAAQTRYPGVYSPVTQSEYQDAVRIAQAVVAWVQALVP